MLAYTTVRQILEELDELPEFQIAEPKGRKWVLREEHEIECAEIYSPPRVTKVVTEIGLRAAWALDFATVDPKDGLPGDFNLEAKRKRAVELLDLSGMSDVRTGRCHEQRQVFFDERGTSEGKA